MEGSGGSGVRGKGPVAESLELAMNNAREEYDNVKLENDTAIEELENIIVGVKEEWELRKLEALNSANSLNGLMERLQIVDYLALEKDEDGIPVEGAIPWIIYFVTLLFMAIELTPIFFKMMLIKSPYDYLEDNIKALQRADLGIEVKHNYYKDKEGVQRNHVIYHEADKKIAEKIKILQTQTELNDFIIDKWKDDERKQISKNPEDYIERG